MYITEEGKISTDLSKLGSILNQSSSLDDKFKDLQDNLDRLTQRNKQNIFQNSKDETADMLTKFTLATIDLFKSLHYIDPKVEAHCLGNIQDLINQALNHLSFLMNIKGFASFDCQTCFLRNDGIRALFGIKSYSTS